MPGGRLIVRVVPATGAPARGFIVAGGLRAPCAIGRSGILRRKREGDGATPAGRFAPLALLYRPDRFRPPTSALPAVPLTPASGWCDDPADRAYNRAVRLPHPARHERLWREDHLYDLVVVLDFNLDPVRKGAGSAIFLHLARADFAPTEGCVAIALPIMRILLRRLTRKSIIVVG